MVSGSGQDPESELNEDGQNNLSLVSHVRKYYCAQAAFLLNAVPSCDGNHGSWRVERWRLFVWCVCACVCFKPYCNFFSSIILIRQGLWFLSACSGVIDPNKNSAKSPQWLHRHPSGTPKLYYFILYFCSGYTHSSYASLLNLFYFLQELEHH